MTTKYYILSIKNEKSLLNISLTYFTQCLKFIISMIIYSHSVNLKNLSNMRIISFVPICLKFCQQFGYFLMSHQFLVDCPRILL